MATFYKTPGVYTEEIPKFPPSIAPVETAIPAFIGYTELEMYQKKTLKGRAVPIGSIAEYEEMFGFAPKQAVKLQLDASDNVETTQATVAFYLYDSLRMFYANGGGRCYIITLGKYPSSTAGLDTTPYKEAFEALENEDEPTLIVTPDAVHLGSGLYTVQQTAIAQCAKLMDRFVICDLHNALTKQSFRNVVEEFRGKIGINKLKYAAAYGPWIQAALPRFIYRRNLTIERTGSPGVDILTNLTSDSDILEIIKRLKEVEGKASGIDAMEGALIGTPGTTLTTRFADFLAAHRTEMAKPTPTVATLETNLQAASSFLLGIAKKIKAEEDSAPDPSTTLFKIKEDLNKARAPIADKLKLMVAHHVALEANTTAPKPLLFSSGSQNDLFAYFGLADFAAVVAASGPDQTATYTAAGMTDLSRIDTAFKALVSESSDIIGLFRFYATTVAEYETKLNQALIESFGTYKTLVAKAAEALNTIPPSGTIAGIYSAVDSDRGVWKAPANVSLNAVIGPAVKVTAEDQAAYNVDVNSGKSINIIRSFTGKGTLVWGARTLAGNDNEWRYVNVRRFFNFVEESCKKATEQFVFEGNDSNTWVRVQAMIENFLTLLWRQGALQGIKPEHAFYVAVGLGKTMTPIHILEGQMIIEIGLAAVRPCEFIIMRFSHKLPES